MRFTLNALPQEIFAKVLQQLQQQGIRTEIVSQAGPQFEYRIQGSGITAKVLYNSNAQLATVDILDKPFIIPTSVIEQKVRDAVAVARG